MEQIQEIVEKEVFINICLDVVGKLIHESLILFRLDSVILIVLPIVFKVDFEPFGHFVWKRSILVEVSQESKPF